MSALFYCGAATVQRFGQLALLPLKRLWWGLPIRAAARRTARRHLTLHALPQRCLMSTTLLMLSLLALGCQSSDDAGQWSTAASPENSVRSEVERGPVRLTVELSPARPQLSDQAQLTLTLRAQRGVRVEKPPFGESLGDFLIRDFYEPPVEVEGQPMGPAGQVDGQVAGQVDGQVDGQNNEQFEITRQVYSLEPTRAGTLTVAPILVRFYDERRGKDGEAHVVESESLTAEVTTMLGDQAPTLADLRPLAGPVELPATGRFPWLGALLVLGLLVLVWIFWRKQRSPATSEPAWSPQELAWQELQQIVHGKLAESDVKEFYVELTGVVRRYIERSTGIRAPEQTTEEFLREIVDDDLFANDDRQRLRDFLESADLVKFAAFHPAAQDIEASFLRAQEFIQLKRSGPPEVAA